MQTSVTLLPIQTDDATHGVEVERICMELAEIDPWRRLEISLERLMSGLLHPKMDAETFLINDRQENIGVLTLQSPWLFGTYIQLFAILPGAQGKGAGRAVMALIEAHARAKAGANIWLCVSGFNEPAQAFYRSNGFEGVGNLTGLILPNEDEILMRRNLGSS